MRIVDLSLPINRRIRGIPNRREYDDNPSRCTVFSSLGDNQPAKLRQRDLEIAVTAEGVDWT